MLLLPFQHRTTNILSRQYGGLCLRLPASLRLSTSTLANRYWAFKNNRSFGRKHPHKRVFDYSGEGLRRTNHTLSVLSFWIRWHDKSRRSERLRTAGLGDRVAFSLSLLSN